MLYRCRCRRTAALTASSYEALTSDRAMSVEGLAVLGLDRLGEEDELRLGARQVLAQVGLRSYRLG